MNTIVVKTNNATQTVSQVQIITKDGVPTVIAAEGQVNYEFHDTSIGYAPNHIITKRIKNDLHVSFEKEGQESDLIIEGFYDDPDSALVGIAEDGEYYYYIPDTGETYDYVTQLEVGDVEGQALGGQDYIAAAIPWWIPAAATLGLAGIAAALSGRGDDNVIAPVNDAPVATDGAISTPEGTAIAVPLIASDIDGVVEGITLTTLPDAAQGVLSYTNAAGDSVPVVAGTPLSAAEAATVRFTPTENFNGTVDDIEFFATDDDGLDSAPATVTVKVTDVNTPPTATDQSLTTDEDTAVPVVLIGDDIDGVVASVTVLQVPPANQGVLSYEDNGQMVELTPGTVLTADQITSVMFTPAPNFNGRVSNIQFSTTDDDGAISAPATVEITVNDVNDAPVATDGAISTPEGTAIAVPLIASDIDGVVERITLTTLPDAAQGVLSYTNAAGDSVPVVAGTSLSAAEAATVLFTPTENFNGAVEAIDFIATDDDGLDSAPATVTLTVTDVNTPPTATDQSLTTDEDTAVPVVLIGDDIDGVVASVTVLQVPPANQGVLSYEDNGQMVELTPGTVLTADQITSVMFTPAPNFNGRVSNIQFSTTDDDGAISAPATVEITVNDVNDAPVATDGAISTPEGTAIAVPLIASDIDGVVEGITLTTLPDAAQGVLSYTNAAGDSVPVVAGTPLSAAEAATVLFTPTENFNGAVEAIDFIATDDDGLDSAPATVTLTVTDVNTPPTATDQSLTTDEDTAVPVVLIGDDIDGVVASVTVLQVPPANQGVLSYEDNGQMVELTPGTVLTADQITSVMFTPAPNFNGRVSNIQFSTTDYDGAISAPATVEITVNDVNDAPVATDGAISTPEGTAIAVPLIASDIDGVVERITLTTLPDAAQGVLSYTNAAGDSVPVVAGTSLSAAEAATVLFTPTENFNGTVDDIEFFATDDDGLDSAPATVTVKVTDVNTPPTADDQSLTTDEDTAVSVPLIGADIDGTVVSVTVLQVPPANQGVLSYTRAGGQVVEITPNTTLSAAEAETVTFTPAPNFNGAVSDIQFSTTDDDGAISAPATVEITVNDVNDAPVATDGAISTPEGTAIAVPLIASDIDGVVEGITLTTLPDAAQGVLSYTNAAGDSVPVVAGTPLSAAEAATVLFTPTENFNGAVEAIDFIATDDDGLDSAPATVTLTVTDVNTPPTATDQSLTTDEDTAVPVVLIGDDIDGVVASVTVLQVPPANQGVLSYEDNGQMVELTPGTVLTADQITSVMFTPAPNFNGRVSNIQFSTTDDDGAISAPATVEITVNDVNDAPVATDGAISTPEGTAIAVPLIASDIDGVVERITLTTLPDAAQGVLSYTNAAGDSVPVVAGTSLSAAEAATVLFTPTENFNGAVEAIDFIATDDDGLDSAPATVTLTVTDVNTPPTATDQSLTTDEDTAVPVVLIGDDIDGVVASVTVLQVPPANQGVLSYEDNGQMVELTPGTVLTADQITSVMFTPAPNFNGRVSNIQFSTTDDDGAISAPATVEITVNDVNDAPVATDGAISTPEGTAIAVPLIASDIDGVVERITLTTLPDAAQGVLSYTNAAGDSVPVVAGTSLSAAEAATVLFTPTENFNGTVDDIEFFATDDDGLDSAPATVTVKVTDVNTPPTADDQSLTTDEDTAVSVPLIGADIDGTVVSVTVLQVPPANQGVLSYTRAGGQVVEITPNTTLSAAEAETVTFTPAPNFNGAVSDIQFSTTDDDGAISAPATVEITVNDVNDAPVATDGAISTPEGTAIAVPLIASDIDGVVEGITLTTLPDAAQGVLSYTNAAGDSVPVVAGTPLSAAEAATVRFTPTENFNGTVDDIEFFATDDDGLDSAPATVTVKVTDVNTPPTADDQSLTTDEDTAVSVPLIGADIDGTVVSVTVLQVPPANQGVLSYTRAGGQVVEITPNTTLSAAEAETVTFTPAPNFNGAVSDIQFSTTDDDGAISAPATVEITVNDVNDAPVATDGAISTPEGTAIAVPLIASDIDGVVEGITLTTLPDAAQGVLSYTNAAGDSVPVVAGTSLSAAEAATVLFTPTENFNGAVEAIDFIATDDDGLDSAPATVTLTVTDVNTPPTATDQSLTTDEDTAVPVVLIGDDIDGVVASVTVLQVPPANQGVLSYEDNGQMVELTPGTVLTADQITSVMFTPAPNFNGRVSNIQFSTTDDDGAISAPATVEITVNDVNDAPVATDGAISTPEGTAIAVPLIASDIDGVVEGITLTTLPDAAQGVLSYTNAAGDSVPVVAGTPLSAAEAATVLFTPTENFNGAVEAIDFIATDDDGLDSAPATVTLTVTDVNTPPTATDQSLTTDEDTAVPVVLIGDDIDGVVASVTVLQVPPANQGVLSYEDNGQMVELTPGTVLTADQITSVMFTPAPNFNGRVSNIQFSTTDDDGAISAPATVEITVNDVNDAPVATDGAISTPEGTAIAVPLIASDIDGVVERITLTTLPDAAQGVLSYTNAAGDSVPVVAGTSLSAAEAATVLFTPTENFNGAVEAIDFIATDDDGLDSAPATVTLTVTDVNTPPTATDQSLTTDEDTAVPVVLIGDDIDGVVASVTVLQVPPANQGVLSYEDNGQMVELTPGTVLTADQITSVMFTPAPNFNGRVSNIQFSTTDDDGAISAPATVEITVNDVNDAPVATDGAISTPEGTAIAVPLIASDIDGVVEGITLTTLPDAAQGVLSYTNAAGDSVPVVAGTSLSAAEAATVLFTPTENFNGAVEAIDFIATDDDGLDSAPATVTLTVTDVNTPPTATDQSLTTDEDTAVPVVLIGDDIDGVVASVTVLQVPPANQGVLSYEDNGQMVELTPGTVLTADQITSVMFTPAPNFNGRVSNIQFSTTDDDGAISAPATVEITVNDVNDAPVATDGAISTPEGTAIAVPLIASDIDGVVERITLTTLPDAAQGVLSYTNAAGDSVPVVAGTPLSAAEAATVRFTPTENFNGTVEAIDFIATDDDGLDSAPATVTLTVTDVNTPPTATDQSLTTDEDTAVPVVLIGDDIDGVVASVTVLQVPPANQGVLSYEDNGQMVELTPGTVLTADQITSVMFTPAPNFNGRVSNIQFSTTDDDGAISAPATVEITVTPVVDITYVVITGDENVIEGEEAEYTVKFLDESGNPVVVTQATDVTVTFNNISTQDADTNYNNAQTITVTIPAGQSSVALDVDTIDDYLADDGENYSLTITGVGANEFEAVDFSDEATNTVTTTIDSNNAGDSANEGGLDSNDVVYVKLTGDDSQVEADDAVLTHTLSLVDADGQPVEIPVSGSVVVNLSYLNDETTAADFDASSKLTTVTFNANTGNQIILTNTVLNDRLKEGNENYQLAISSVDGTNSGFESVQIDTENSVTGEIVDDVDLKPDVNTVQEDGVLTATGNVLANDEVGTETSVSLQSQPSDANDYGALTLNNDGSYTYVLNNNSSTVQALARGEVVEQVFTYRVGDDTQTLTITVTGTNDAPTLDVSGNSNTTVNYTTAYQEGDVPVAISDSSTIADIDNNDTIGSAFIVLTNSQTGDLIAIDEGDLPAGISATLLGNSRIELSGSASLADYQTAIDAITFANTSATPSEIDRIIEVTVTDINNANSNTTTTVISVDATPQAVDDSAQVTEGGKTISSNTTSLNLLTNDDLGTANTTITSFTYLDENGDSQTVAAGSVVDTQYGSLTINANGTWTYTSDDTSDNMDGIIDSISYTITDADGDTSTADFNITVDDTQPTALIPEVTLNEDDLTGGTDTAPDALRTTRNLGITKAADDISDVVFTGVTTAGLEALALESNGEPLTYQVSNGGHTVVASSATGNSVFAITLTSPTDSTGDTQAFVFELQGQLDHTDGFDEITLPIKYELQDTDSTSVQQFNVFIKDDDVEAKDDTPVSVVEGSYIDGDDSTLLTGNVIDNDKGADADLKINTFTYLDKDGNTVEDSTEFGVSLETPTGTLTVNEDGSWTFAANKAIDNRVPAPPLPDPQEDGSFSYTLIDADGDVSSTARQPISVTDTAPVIESDESVILKEDELFPNSGTASTYVVKVDSAFTVTGNEDNISDIYFTMGDGDLINGRFQSSGLPLYYRYAEVDGVIDYSTLYVSTTQRGELVADTVDNPNNNVIFKVEINPEGLPYTSADALTYTATLYDTIRHDNIDADNDGRLDNIIFDLDYAVVDEDGSITEDQFDVEVENRLFNKDLDFTINEGDFADITGDENIAPNGKNALLINAAENFDGGVVTILNYDLSSSRVLQSGQSIYIDVNGNAIATDDQDNPAIVGSLKNIGNGQIEFNPEENYSSIATPNDRNVGTAEAPTGYEQTPDSFDPNYSVMFNIRLQDGGQTLTSRINIEVDPVADAPIIVIDAAEVDIVDGVYTNDVKEDSSTQLGFIAPIIGDNGGEASTDLSIYDDPVYGDDYINGTKSENDDNTNGGSVDRSERFGAITLSGFPDGVQLFYTDVNGVQDISDRIGEDGTITFKLTDGTHINNEFTADVENMTSADFESLIVSNPDQNATNFTVTMSVTEYEVDENGIPYPLEPNDSSSADPDGSLIGETTSVDILIDVQAVTDASIIDLVEPDTPLPPGTTSITLSDDPNNGIDKNDTINAVIDEDSSLDLQSILNETFIDDDGSEEYWYSIEGFVDALNGQVVTINGNSYTIADGTVTLPKARVTASDLDPSFTFTPPKDFAGVINATLTLNTQDTDADSVGIAPAIQTASVQLNITVNPTIDVTAVNPQAGAEDTAIALFTTNAVGDSVFTITDQNGSGEFSKEEFSKIGISQSSLDASGGTVLNENNQIVDLTTLATETIDGDIYYIFGNNPSDVAGFTIKPPAHSSTDISLTYFVETTDGSVDSANPITENETFDVTIKVTPVAERADIDSDGDNSNDVTLNPDHTYSALVFEDGDADGISSTAPVWYDLSTDPSDTNFDLLDGWSNEDDTNDNNIYTKSEETFARLIVQIRAENGDWVNASGAQFRYDSAGETQTVTAGKNGIDIPVAGLSSLAFIPPNNYSGELRIQEQAVTIDYDEDDDTATDKVVSGESFLYLTVTPVADDVLLSVQPAKGEEDAGRSNGNPTDEDSYTPDDTIDNPEGGIALKIKAQSKDKDGSETFNVTIDAIPDGAYLYVWDADNGANGGYVLIDQNYGAVNDVTTVDNADDTWSVTLTDYQSDKVPSFIPPLNSNDNYTLQVTGVSVDGTDTSEPSASLALPIKIDTIADKILNDELNKVTFDYGGQTSDNYAVILEESALDAANSEIAFRSIFKTPEDIRSYDDDGSEIVTYVITGLDDRFAMQGADVTFIGGEGTARQWVVTDEAINNGEIILKTADNFAGEINFNIKGVSTEKTGGSEASQNLQPVQIFVKPDALDNDVVNPTAEQNENDSVTLDFERAFRRTDNPDDWTSGVEELKSVAISVTDLEALGVQLTVGVGVNSVVITSANLEVADAGFYTIERDSEGALPKASIIAIPAEPASSESGFVNYQSGNDVYDFGIKYTVTDTVRATNNETADIVYQTSQTRETTFVVDVLPTTNVPSLVNLAEIETSETIDIDNADVADDEVIKTVTLTSPDLDGSEVFTRVQVDGVPDGILVQVDANGDGTFVDAVKAGDTWYVDFDDETIDTFITASVDIKFSVKAGYDVDNADGLTITVTAYNQDAPDVEKSADATFELTLITGMDGGVEEPPELVADLIVKSITLTEDGAGQSLDNFIIGSLNQVAYDNQTSAPISFTIANLPDDVVLQASNGVSLSKQGNTWLISGNVTSDSDIADLLSNISIIPTSDYSTNNQSEAVALDISFTATDSNGDSETVTADDPAFPIGDPDTNDSTLIVLPITDYFGFHEEDPTAAQNDDNIVIAEDETRTLTLDLTKTADVGNVEIIGGNVYLQFADNASVNGTLEDSNGVPLATVSNPAGLPIGEYFVLPVGANNPTSANFNFIPERNEDGATVIETYVVHKETTDIPDHDITTLVSRKDFEVTVEKGADPLLFVVNEAASNLTVDEDQGEIGDTTDVNVVSIVYDTVQTDEDEGDNDQPASFIINNINDNFTVYYVNDSGDIVIANKTGTGSWSLPSTETNPTPEIFIQAPENYSGTSSAVISVLSTDGLQGDTTTVDLVFNPIADGVELTPQNSAGKAYTWVELNTNAKMEDTDGNDTGEGGSETLTLTITPEDGKPFDESMLFRIGDTGEVIGLRNADNDGDEVSVEFVAGSYVLSGVPSSSINDIQILYQSYNGTITYTGKTVETSGPEQVFSSEENKTADLNLSDSVAIETGEQNDTIATTNSSTTVNSGAGDDRITGGAGDDFLDGGTGVNTLIGGAGNDKLVFSFDNSLMDGGDGIDTLLINVANTTIDFGGFDSGVIENIEMIDLTGNDAQSLINIGTNDVITMTESNNELFINGDDEDKISLTAEFVEQEVSDQADYIQYQSTIDSTVNLYVHEDITIL